jgi:hypothetical protein
MTLGVPCRPRWENTCAKSGSIRLRNEIAPPGSADLPDLFTQNMRRHRARCFVPSTFLLSVAVYDARRTTSAKFRDMPRMRLRKGAVPAGNVTPFSKEPLSIVGRSHSRTLCFGRWSCPAPSVSF